MCSCENICLSCVSIFFAMCMTVIFIFIAQFVAMIVTFCNYHYIGRYSSNCVSLCNFGCCNCGYVCGCVVLGLATMAMWLGV